MRNCRKSRFFGINRRSWRRKGSWRGAWQHRGDRDARGRTRTAGVLLPEHALTAATREAQREAAGTEQARDLRLPRFHTCLCTEPRERARHDRSGSGPGILSGPALRPELRGLLTWWVHETVQGVTTPTNVVLRGMGHLPLHPLFHLLNLDSREILILCSD